ncbi:sigma-54-dependent transcriptional regulator [Duganella violaceipulchra]|uniref:Sigma-54 dependent transcriptional regulator n=1 Tax=Duganella violaceipulchra TaxID=2849652 RepID=A0AA41H8U2_9BURK|nr:sigma-54 dependent transcriptional regulator [Duganella violaceicalia]MBV6320254.1 sigma-54 dependent transcriptional regulator [Duganella violaceicalia]MCP2011703.1 two-component system response regulator PilR (NtrC family) [Duganella violaceicalia]
MSARGSQRAPRVLVVDDEADLRELLELTLLKMGLDVDSAATLAQARGLLATPEREYQLVLTDMRLPDGLGLELVREVSAAYKNTPIAVVTAFGSADNAVIALKAGAFDYISKPVALDQLRVMVQSALRLNAEPPPGEAPSAEPAASRLKGESAVIQALRAQIARLARSMAPIAINGESGSGKELAAREIHAQSSRNGKPFIAVNCGAIPEALMEAEFFGYRKGAFTGAADERDGFFQAANGGTLMLDEVADLPLAMQVKLLRAIQERRVRKIGATAEEPVDVRIISATHKNLAQCVEQGSFRQDLFYRLNVIELSLPPLRERLDDLAVLTGAILDRLGTFEHQVRLGEGVLDALRGYSFPGNVRELENILERALAFANDGVIEVADLALKGARMVEASVPLPTPALPLSTWNLAATEAAALGVAPLPSPPPAEPAPPATGTLPLPHLDALPSSLPDYLNQVERDIILRALAQTQFNRTQAAQLLGISFRQLRYQMQKLNIQEPEA